MDTISEKSYIPGNQEKKESLAEKIARLAEEKKKQKAEISKTDEVLPKIKYDLGYIEQSKKIKEEREMRERKENELKSNTNPGMNKQDALEEARDIINNQGIIINSENIDLRAEETNKKFEKFSGNCKLKYGYRPYVHNTKDDRIIFNNDIKNDSTTDKTINISKDGYNQKSLTIDEYAKFLKYLDNTSNSLVERTKKFIGKPTHPNYLFVKYAKLKNKNSSVEEINEEMAKILIEIFEFDKNKNSISDKILNGNMQDAKNLLSEELLDRIKNLSETTKLKEKY